MRHMPRYNIIINDKVDVNIRIINLLRKGLAKFSIGSKDSKVDWVHVDNLVHAHILASQRLSEENLGKKKEVVAGNPYFINDQAPINNFEFFRPIFEGLGYSYPIVNLPVNVMYYVALIIGKILNSS